MPAEHPVRLEQLDRLISEVADESTPIRLGWTDDGHVAVMTHCRSRVIPDFSEVLGPGDRIDERGDVALAELIRHALTYRRR